ncbi:MAG: hypothetical protein GXP41_09735 [Chloroflexi bacterium]|nr:hypothetical protein [Chloroflexota bacterium]
MDIIIRRLETAEEYKQTEDLQQAIWTTPDRLDVIPIHVQATVQRNGGLVLGAFAPDGEMVGYLLGFLGQHTDGRIKHCSHQMGVLTAYRSHGVGTRLKLVQREEVLQQGFDLITWTYDPLEGPNAHLNIARLGATCSMYLRKPYGDMEDALNKGVDPDRFEVTWWIGRERVAKRVAALRAGHAPHLRALPSVAHINHPQRTETGLLIPDDWQLPGGEPFLVEVPPNFREIKKAARELAVAWRENTRDLFEAAFAAGYEVQDFFSITTSEGRRNFYLLQTYLLDNSG